MKAKNMEWKVELESLDGLNERYHSLYTAGDDGKFVLDEGVKSLLSDRQSLATTVKTVRQERDALKPYQAALKTIGVDAPDGLTPFVEDLRSQAAKAAGAEEHVERVKKDLEASHTNALAEKDERIQSLIKALEAKVVEAESMSAIVAADGKPKLLQPILAQRVRMVEDEGKFSARVFGADGEPMLDGSGGFMSIEGYLKKLKADTDFDDAFNASGTRGPGTAPGGRGSPGSSGKNPWAKDTRNMTEQGRIERENPTLAARLKAEAGVKSRYAAA